MQVADQSSKIGKKTPFDPKPESASRERFQRVHRILRDRICLLEYTPGQRLSEGELAAEFGSSRTPIRRVLGRLEAEGLIERRHGVGTIVTDVDREALEQVYRLRIEIASLMGRLAPLNCDEAQIAKLERHRETCRALARDPDAARFVRLQMQFDLDTFSMIGNQPLREIIERLYFQTTRMWIKMILVTEDILREVHDLERKIADILDALRAGDHAAVGDLSSAHIAASFVQMRLHSWFEDKPGASSAGS